MENSTSAIQNYRRGDKNLRIPPRDLPYRILYCIIHTNDCCITKGKRKEGMFKIIFRLIHTPFLPLRISSYALTTSFKYCSRPEVLLKEETEGMATENNLK